MENDSLSQYYLVLILIPIICGTLARYLTLIVDYRQYPSYPNGYLIHLVTGFISSGIGAIAIPALLEKNFEAVTFLLLATEQFREVRRIEKESLQVLDDVEHVFRGEAYIDGIAKTFEACRILGLKRYNYTRCDYETGRIAIILVPIIYDEGAFIETIKKTPLLESIKKNDLIKYRKPFFGGCYYYKCLYKK